MTVPYHYLQHSLCDYYLRCHYGVTWEPPLSSLHTNMWEGGEAANIFTWTTVITSPHPGPLDMFKRVHYVAHTSGRRWARYHLTEMPQSLY